MWFENFSNINKHRSEWLLDTLVLVKIDEKFSVHENIAQMDRRK